jgi:hypothetical protein
MKLPCGHDLEDARHLAGADWRSGLCRLCWNAANRPDAARRYAELAALSEGAPALDKPPELPSLGKQILNAGAALARHVAGGLRQASPEEQSRRLELCLACDQYVGGRCAKCGCFTKTKAAWAEQTCPLGKW